MAEPKTIYCPWCKRKVTHYDGKQTINPRGKCRKCGKLVIYDIEKDETIVKKIPKRDQGSGMMIW